jgi:hypothetical protein
MRRRKENRSSDQVGLFRPESPTPGWFDLKEEVRDKATRLLARLLRERRERERVVRGACEVTHG